MGTMAYDPVTALVHLRIEDLRREAAADALARAAYAGRCRRARPAAAVAVLVAALRGTFERAAGGRRAEPCPTC